MYKGRSIVAFIPARGGSVRIPNKNMTKLCGKPLIEHTLKSAKNSKLVDFTMVSSDSQKILDFASKQGSGTILRPDKISGCRSSTEEAIDHAINGYLKSCDIMVMLQPTSPIRNIGRIDEAIKLLVGGNYNSVVSVCDKFQLTWDYVSGCGHPNYDNYNRPSSHSPTTLEENGSIYAFNIEQFIKEKSRIIHPVGLIRMTEEESIDIDTPLDFKIADITMSSMVKVDNKSINTRMWAALVDSLDKSWPE